MPNTYVEINAVEIYTYPANNSKPFVTAISYYFYLCNDIVGTFNKLVLIAFSKDFKTFKIIYSLFTVYESECHLSLSSTSPK